MRDRALTMALALLAVLLFAGLFMQPKAQLSYSMPHSEDQGEQGQAALFQWLQLRKLPVSSWRERWSNLAERHIAGHVLISPFPYQMQDEQSGSWEGSRHAYVDGREREAMVRWIAAGNTVVLPMGALDAQGQTAEVRDEARSDLTYVDLLRDIGWSLTINAAEPNDSAQDESPPDGNTAQLRPQALHRLQFQPNPLAAPIQAEHLAWEAQGKYLLNFAPMNTEYECKRDEDQSEDDDRGDDEDAGEDEDVEVADGDEELYAENDLSSSEAEPAGEQESETSAREDPCQAPGVAKALPILRSQRDQSEAGWYLPFGRGGVVVLGYASLWRNPNLGSTGAANMAQQLLQSYVKPGGEILFDDYRYGLSRLYDPDALMKDPRLHKTLAIALGFWLLYALGRQRRMLQLRSPKVRVSSATFAVRLQEFFGRQLTRVELAGALTRHFVLRAGRHYGENVDANADALWLRLQRDSRFDQRKLAIVRQLSDGSDNEQLNQILVELERRFQH
jgi:hypothetical protein